MIDRSSGASALESSSSSAPTVVARSLAGFWNDARLHADDAKSTSVRPAPTVVPWRTALEELLNVGYGLQTQCRYVNGAWEQMRWRTTPSAGALYPFEVIACVIGEGSYVWDVESSRLLACGLAPLVHDDTTAMGLTAASGPRVAALLVIVVRPWLSMKKYRQRGYPYCHLDAGHVTANLAVYASTLGHAPTAHLRFDRASLVDRLGLGGLCREPIAVLSFASRPPVAARDAIQIAAALPGLTSLDPPGAAEIENWESLKGLLSFDHAIERPLPTASTPLVTEPAHVHGREAVALLDGLPPPSTAHECRSAILARRSAKGFHDQPLTSAHLGQILGALRSSGLPSDCTPRDGRPLGVRVAAANVDGLSGVFAYSPARHALHRLDTRMDDHRPACMKQRTAESAAALLLFHTPRRRLLTGYSGFAEAHFHAAQLGQRLHLSAARLGGVGMTCIGGFDGERCAALTRLDDGEEPVYVMLLGVPDDSAGKDDRLRVAFSHGYTTEEG